MSEQTSVADPRHPTGVMLAEILAALATEIGSHIRSLLPGGKSPNRRQQVVRPCTSHGTVGRVARPSVLRGRAAFATTSSTGWHVARTPCAYRGTCQPTVSWTWPWAGSGKAKRRVRYPAPLVPDSAGLQLARSRYIHRVVSRYLWAYDCEAENGRRFIAGAVREGSRSRLSATPGRDRNKHHRLQPCLTRLSSPQSPCTSALSSISWSDWG